MGTIRVNCEDGGCAFSRQSSEAAAVLSHILTGAFLGAAGTYD